MRLTDMNKKKVTITVLVLSLLFCCLAGCGSRDKTDGNTGTPSSIAENPGYDSPEKIIAICSGTGTADANVTTIGYSSAELETNMSSSQENAYEDEEPGEITVYSLRYRMYLNSTIEEFMSIHPNITVHYEYGVSDDNGITAEDAVSALNTELLSGEGPDIIVMDGLNLENYQDNGVLMELSGVYDEIMEENPSILSNILNAYRTDDGKIYAMPSRVQFPMIVGPWDVISDINTLDDVTEFVKTFEKRGEDINGLNIYDWRMLFKVFYPLCADDIIDEDGNYHEEELRAFMEDMKELWNVLLSQTTPERIEQYYEDVEENPAINFPVQNMEPKLFNSEYSGQYISVCNAGAIATIETACSIRLMETVNQEDYYWRMLGDGSLYMPKMIFAVNANTKSEKAAVSFYKEMYREELQKRFLLWDGTEGKDDGSEGSGIEINVDAIRQGNKDNHGGGGSGCGEVTARVYFYFPDEGDMEELIARMGKLSHPVNSNEEIRQMIEDGMTGYMDGSEDLESAVQKISALINIYSNE